MVFRTIGAAGSIALTLGLAGCGSGEPNNNGSPVASSTLAAGASYDPTDPTAMPTAPTIPTKPVPTGTPTLEVTPTDPATPVYAPNSETQRSNLDIIHGYGWLTSKGATDATYDPSGIGGWIGYSPNGQFPVSDGCDITGVVVNPDGTLSVLGGISFTTPQQTFPAFGNGCPDI